MGIEQTKTCRLEKAKEGSHPAAFPVIACAIATRLVDRTVGGVRTYLPSCSPSSIISHRQASMSFCMSLRDASDTALYVLGSSLFGHLHSEQHL